IARKLGVSGRARVAFRSTFRDLERAGEIARIRKDRYVLPAEADLVTGKLSVHPAGYGFLTSEKPGEPDVFIAAEDVGTAMHGDRVVARISLTPPSGRIKRRREGRVIRIHELGHDSFDGTFQLCRHFYYIETQSVAAPPVQWICCYRVDAGSAVSRLTEPLTSNVVWHWTVWRGADAKAFILPIVEVRCGRSDGAIAVADLIQEVIGSPVAWA